jgi:alanyl-tRNA synthetase
MQGLKHHMHACVQMLGAFSFGDYFKADAIRMAWELSTAALGIPAGRIWVSVYEGDAEAARLWRDVVGFPPERLVRLGDADNFWASGCAPFFYPCIIITIKVHCRQELQRETARPDCAPVNL